MGSFFKKLSGFVKRFGSWILVAVISVSFVAYIGLNEPSLSLKRRTIGTVSGYPIAASRGSLFADVYANLSNLYVSNGYEFGEEIEKSVVERAFYEGAAFYLVGKKARELGFFIEDAAVWDFVKKKYYDGNPILFKNFLRNSDDHFKKTVFEKGKNTILRGQLEAGFFSSVPFSDFEWQHLLNLAALKKKSLVGVVRVREHLAEVVKEEALKKYFEANKGRYAGKDKKEIDFPSAKKAVLEDFLIEKGNEVREATRDFYYKEISKILMKVNESKDSLDEKRRLFSTMLGRLKMAKGETGYVSFFSSKTPFISKDFVLEDDDIVLQIMKTRKGKARVVALSNDELKIVFVTEEKKEILDASSFIFERYRREFSGLAQSRLRSQYYKKLLDEAKVDFTYGKEATSDDPIN